MLVALWLVLFLVGSTYFIVCGVMGYFMAKSEFKEPVSVLCPETMQPADVQVDAALAAKSRLVGREELVVTTCSRWPENHNCDQSCTPQVPLLGDSRTRTEIAAFGLQPEQLRINNPVRMTTELYAKMTAQLQRR